jgi:hypothetical protein
MRQILQYIKETRGAGRVIESVSATSQIEAEEDSSKQDNIKTTTQLSMMFHVTPSMLCMDEIVFQTPLKDLAQTQLVMTRIPTKALYKMKVSVA